MTLMLASVTGPAEAELAVAAQVHLVGLKDPTTGALAALPVNIIADAVAAVARRRPVSATAGDLAPLPQSVVPAVRRICGTGVDYVKIGMLHPQGWVPWLRGLRDAVAVEARLIGVLFADQPHDLSIVAELAAAGFAGVMLDTMDKQGAGLRRHLGDDRLRAFVACARDAGLMTGLAGSLGADDIEPLLAIGPDYLGFRGALCRRGARGDSLDPAALDQVRGCFPAPRPVASAPGSRRRFEHPLAPFLPTRF